MIVEHVEHQNSKSMEGNCFVPHIGSHVIAIDQSNLQKFHESQSKRINKAGRSWKQISYCVVDSKTIPHLESQVDPIKKQIAYSER